MRNHDLESCTHELSKEDIISLVVAKRSTKDPTMSGHHVQLASQRQQEFWTYQSQKAQAHQTLGLKTTP